ncbi:GHMP kinase [Candidatus Sumerlaeota bacterium]|nr:GHMP kinase [Candidatus Sumerlaeota bacterium]
MKIIETHAHARAGLMGNPSDGYFGKTLSIPVRNFSARIVLYEWERVEVLPNRQDHVRFGSLQELASEVGRNGYFGGMPLIAAALKKFHDYCQENDVALPRENFSIRYETDVPRQVGMAGSSAIVTATFLALMQFYEIEIPLPELPNWVLATEVDELRIRAGLQDRVVQCYDAPVFMDFDREIMERQRHGEYETLDPALFPPLYLAYKEWLSEVSGIVHNDLRERWDRGDQDVHDAMQEFARLATEARQCLLDGRPEQLGPLMDANFDLRRKIMKVSPENLKMVETARKCGASAKFCGSGGAIVGVCPDDKTFNKLTTTLGRLGCTVIRPRILPDH